MLYSTDLDEQCPYQIGPWLEGRFLLQICQDAVCTHHDMNSDLLPTVSDV